MSTLIGVVGDTHVPSRGRTLPVEAWKRLVDCELILHTGDVCDPALLDELAEWAPVEVAMGNCDPPEVRAWGARDVVSLDVEGVGVAMLHDSGRRDGRPERMRKRFPDAAVVIYGHSHVPLIERYGGLLLVNPGSPTDRRRSPDHTIALLRVEDGRADAELVVVDPVSRSGA